MCIAENVCNSSALTVMKKAKKEPVKIKKYINIYNSYIYLKLTNCNVSILTEQLW